LELHHLTYDLSDVTHHPDHVGVCIFGHETPDVLRALCRECHLARHVDPNGEFWVDPIEMATYWESFYKEQETG
jgi:hypothetical protein